MARPKKKGLDYFPLDTDFFEDPKIGAIAGEFGCKGEIVAIKLLCAIYREGYFILWNDMLRLKFLKEVAGVNTNLLDAIIERLVKWGFFDENLFISEKILTSKGIQDRYFAIAKRRNTTEDSPHLLVNACNNRVSAYKNPAQTELLHAETPQRKVKESKDNIDNNILIDQHPPTNSYHPQEKYLQKECAKLCLDDEIWLNGFMCHHSIPSKDEIKQHLIKFLESNLVRDNTEKKTISEFKRHFDNWLRKQLHR